MIYYCHHNPKSYKVAKTLTPKGDRFLLLEFLLKITTVPFHTCQNKSTPKLLIKGETNIQNYSLRMLSSTEDS